MADDEKIHLSHEIFILDTNLQKLIPSDSKEMIHDFIESLLSNLKMEKLGPLEWYPATDLRAPGFSFIQPITTSHISGHYFDKPGKFPHLHLDIYSCKAFEWKEVIAIVDTFFSMRDWKANCIFRSIEQERSYKEMRGLGKDVLEAFNLTKSL